MTEFLSSSILDSNCDYIVIPVNTKGVMEVGLAKEFAQKFPNYYEMYKDHCHNCPSFKGGDWLVIDRGEEGLEGKKFILLATKEEWRNPSKLEWIERGLISLKQYFQVILIIFKDVKSLAIPAIGCGLGGLNWASVISLMETYLLEFDNLTLHIYPPQ